MPEKKKSIIQYAVRIIIMLAIAAAIIAAACIKRPSAEENSRSFNVEYDLTVWYYDESLNDFLSSAADGFLKETGLRADFVHVSSIDFFDTINELNNAGEGAPDLYIVDSTKLESAYLSSLAKQNDNELYISENFTRKSLDACLYKDKLAAYPLCFDVSFLAYNNDLIKNVPETFDEIIASYYSGQNTGESSLPEAFDFDPSDLLYSYFFIGNYIDLGGKYGDDASSFDLSSENYTQALQFMQYFNGFLNIDTNVSSQIQVENEFADNKLGMGIFSPDSLKKFDNSRINYSISDIPPLTENLDTKTLSLTSVICVNPKSKSTENAERLAVYLTYDAADGIYEKTGYFSAKNLEYDNKAFEEIVKCYENSDMLPKLIETEELWGSINTMLCSVWDGQDIEKCKNKLNVAVYIALSTRTRQEDKTIK